MPTSRSPAYRERLGVPLRWWVQGTMLVASLWLALVVAVPGTVAWPVTAVATAALVAALAGYGSAVVEVGDGRFRAGRAVIGAHHLGAAEALGPEEARLVAGRDADARAYLLLRPYTAHAVRVAVLDPRDPTPYWLVSTRHPDALASALTALVASSAERDRGSEAGR